MENSKNKAPDATPQAREEVLLLEDDELSRKMIMRVLEKKGYKIMPAENGRVALHKLEQNYVPGVCLVDLNMPEVNGFEFLEKIRESTDLYTLPIFILTAQRDRDTVLRATEYGIDGYVGKPIDFEGLEKKMQEIGTPEARQKRLHRVKTYFLNRDRLLKRKMEKLEKIYSSNHEKLRQHLAAIQQKIAATRRAAGAGSKTGAGEFAMLKAQQAQAEKKLQRLTEEYEHTKNEILRRQQVVGAHLSKIEAALSIRDSNQQAA